MDYTGPCVGFCIEMDQATRPRLYLVKDALEISKMLDMYTHEFWTWLIGSCPSWDYLFEIQSVHSIRALMCTKCDYLQYASIGPQRPAFVFVSSELPSQNKHNYKVFLIWYGVTKVRSPSPCRRTPPKIVIFPHPPFCLTSSIHTISWEIPCINRRTTWGAMAGYR